MDGQTSQLQPETRHAEFRLSFPTALANSQFRLGVTVARQGGGFEYMEVTSKVTPPTISVTNEVQWEEAEGMLIERVAFQFQEQCSWSTLCNYLQRHLIHATRQNICQLQRIFCLAELSYFQRAFFGGSGMVKVDQFAEFWKWYGKAAHKIRYSKHVLSLYLRGLLFGFIAKQEMEVALSGRPPGTFMIRFSERNAGSFSIAYVTQDVSSGHGLVTMVRHYLVSSEDITQRKSLADFIYEAPALTHFLRFEPRSGFSLVPSPMGENVTYELKDKREVLHEFAKPEPVVHTSGYDRQLNPQPPSHAFQNQLKQEAPNMDGGSVLSGYGLGSAAGKRKRKKKSFFNLKYLVFFFFYQKVPFLPSSRILRPCIRTTRTLQWKRAGTPNDLCTAQKKTFCIL
jgi:hypothetical protein